MTTVRDLIQQSLRTIGALATGETASADESNDAFIALNQLVDSLATESLLIYNTAEHVFSLTALQQTYTVGDGGAFNVPRPWAIEAAYLRNTDVLPNIDLPMRVLSQAEWADIRVKGTQSTYPLWCYLDLGYPLDTLYVWPVPLTTKQLVLWLWEPLASFQALDDSVRLPRGYERFLRFALAAELSLEYGRAIGPELEGLVASARANVKRINTEAPLVRCDNAVLGARSRGTPAWVVRADGRR